jgi:c(7)-type cytochrome triheme protein
MRRVAAILLAVAAMAAAADDSVPWFSHKRHAGLEMTCVSCHDKAPKSTRAGMPPASRCLSCHKLKFTSSHPFPAEYDNLPGYVIFSHARHLRAKVECADCHGDVNRQERTEPARVLNMPACLACHQARDATAACKACHKQMP